MLCTFGRDAARELEDRFARSALACGLGADLSGVRISTIHSLCHRLLAPHAGEVGLRPAYRVLDEREQHLLLHQEFGAIFGPDWDILSGRGWRDGVHTVAEAARYFDRICDELIDPAALAGSQRLFVAALGRCLRRYRDLLLAKNMVDFAHLQVWAESVMRDGIVAAQAGEAVRRLMVDELQDTSRIQLRILSRLAGVHGNIVVVGDDDQSIYRFRGASVANLLEFPRWFPGCRVVELTTNYRSHRGIVAAVGRWMNTAAEWEVDGQSYRYAKDIVPGAPDSHPDYPSVIAVPGAGGRDESRRLGELLRFLRFHGVIASYGQVALLLHSVQDRVSGPYLDGLELAGVPARCEPAGHVRGHAADELLVTTVHQAKGREWDVVVVGSLTGPDWTRTVWGATSRNAGPTPENQWTTQRTSTVPVATTWPSPGRGACWCSPPPASRRAGSEPYGRALTAGRTWTGMRYRASGSGIRGRTSRGLWWRSIILTG